MCKCSSATQRMRLRPNGNLGIGTNSLATAFQLGVDDDVNISTTYNGNTNNQLGYRINGVKLLNNPGQFNTFVGERAGSFA